MKQILFILLFFAATFSVQGQSQNWYMQDITIVATEDSSFYYVELPPRFLSMWNLGGSYSVENTGGVSANYSIYIQGTSDNTAAFNSEFTSVSANSPWQTIKSLGLSSVAASGFGYGEIATATETRVIKHSRVRIVFQAVQQPGELNINILFKKTN